MEITVTLELNCLELICNDEQRKKNNTSRLLKSYHEKITIDQKTKVSKRTYPSKDRNEEEEAALMEYFIDVLGLNEFNDLIFDELHLPLKEIELP